MIEKIREGLYIKKDKFGYRVIYPVRNEDRTINWFNLLTGGTWWKLLKVIVIVLLILGMVWSYKHDIGACLEFQDTICDNIMNISAYCMKQQQSIPNLLLPSDFKLNEGVEDER